MIMKRKLFLAVLILAAWVLPSSAVFGSDYTFDIETGKLTAIRHHH